jgi:hypothetical protein
VKRVNVTELGANRTVIPRAFWLLSSVFACLFSVMIQTLKERHKHV